MPFTLSHAAAVLPGIRRDGAARGPLIASALVAGSFSPDMTYFAASFVPAAMPFGDVTHSVVGVVTVDVLITAVLAGLWLLLREPVVALLPRGWQGRVHAFVRGQSWRGARLPSSAWRFALSAAIGASTHVFWDTFTHLDRWGMKVLPVLGEIVAGFPVYLYLQYGGSAVALVVIVWFVASSLCRLPAAASPPVPALDARGRWSAAALLVGCAAVGAVHRCVRWYAYHGDGTLLGLIPSACFGAGAGLAVGLLLYATTVRLRTKSPDRLKASLPGD
ncbi:DUF4184 family protein [Streptomyces sannanensis]|uniref:DUF4184 family protein n=1 Tax=Streptomyces sannanensis TaxID=285536 RepID=A0ABP6S7S7_9ACTN